MTLTNPTSTRELRRRCIYTGLAMSGWLLVMVFRLYRLQITQGEEYSAKSVENFVRDLRVRADRGIIKDTQGDVLVDSRPSFDLFITPAFCQHCSDEVIPKLAAWLKWDESQVIGIENQIKVAKVHSGPFQPVPVRLDLSRGEFDLVNAHRLELPGVEALSIPHRSYRLGTMLAHVLGYMNEINPKELERLNSEGKDYALGDFIGREGLEHQFEENLRGDDGTHKEVVNARGEAIPELNSLIGTDEDVAPTPGHNLVLSIDLRLQEAAEKAFPGAAGAVVAIEVKTGFIAAMISRPSFDPNVMTGRVSSAQMAALKNDPLKPMIFRPLSGTYSPGSTFKPITALAALRSGLFSPQTIVNCPGGYRLGKRLWRCWKDSGHGPKDARGALQQSCDTYYYKVADTIGLDAIAQVGKELGLGQPTGLGVASEKSGIMPDTAYHDRVTPGGYTKGMALNSAIGQGDDNVTPLQLAMVYAALANGGEVLRPQLVRRIENVDGTIAHEFKPELLRSVKIDAEHRRVIVEALSAVVNEAGGTAYRSRLKDIKVAGKTGTAQVQRLGMVRLKTQQIDFFHRDHAWFASFAPVDDPELAVVVLNEHGGHGASDAAPVAMAIIQKYFDLKKRP